jgi:hypothetical protein
MYSCVEKPLRGITHVTDDIDARSAELEDSRSGVSANDVQHQLWFVGPNERHDVGDEVEQGVLVR